ncbi:hypothetical protein Droror1_Dr00012548 [Drosera rotundifolia]
MGTQLVFKFVNLISFPVLILFACLIAPPYLIIKFVTFILSFFKAEDVSEKVILITGASSGIGEHLAYAYARRGACLALAARRENRLLEVAHKAKRLGSPKVLIITADVSKADDCKRIVDKTIDHFGRVDHLVNNAGVASACTLEKYSDITAMKPLMDINFWGAVYTTRFALPHLRKNKGKIVAVSSPSHWIALPTASSYNASKAAIVSLFETLRMEVASEISVVLLVPGFVESEMTNGKHITLKGDEMKTNETVRNVKSAYMEMDLVNKFLNLVAPPFTFFTLCFLLPPLKAFMSFLCFLRNLASEDISGKVVLITGASSGIGEHLAYEYATRGACLVLAARREGGLRQVANRCQELGSPDVLVVPADVASYDDCKKIVESAINHFGRLDHLVNNAGISTVSLLEEYEDVKHARPVMASKAAMRQLFDTLMVELGPEIKITIVTPGFIESELTKGKFLSKEGKMTVDQEMRDVQVNLMPICTAEGCAKGVVNAALRGDGYVTEPAWFRVTYYWKIFFPELVEWIFRLFYLTSFGDSARDTLGKKILDLTGAQSMLYPKAVQTAEIKTD